MGEPNWKNRTLFHCDNLPVLRAMNTESVDLIATDPPFNKSRDFHATPDSLAAGASFQDRWSWERDVHRDWVDQITDDFPRVINVVQGSRNSYGDDMGAFLCFMAVRLLEMHRVLKNDGAIYLHCDPTASHYLKELMDSIFGKKNFRNEIVWRRTGSHNSADRFGPIHDTLLFYAKSGKYSHNVQFTPYLRGHVDEYFKKSDSRGQYWTNSIHGSGVRRGKSGKPWRGFDPTASGRHWAVPSELVLAFGIGPDLPQHEKLDALYERGLIDLPKPGSGSLPTYRQYLQNSPGQPIQDLWIYEPHTKGCLYGQNDAIDHNVRWIPKRDKNERVGFPTQKPIGLYERIVRASSDEGDIVFDPFAGCTTTLVAAERLKRQWVGIDIWDNAKDIVLRRLEREGLIDPESTDGRHGQLFAEDVTFTPTPPNRTDDGEPAAPTLRTKVKVFEPRGPKMSRIDMYTHLLSQKGCKCQGCDRTFDDPRYLDLDHNTPRSDGGINHISNRILLCGPCNRTKSNTLTLTGLRRKNKREGFMFGSSKENPIMKQVREQKQKVPPLFK